MCGNFASHIFLRSWSGKSCGEALEVRACSACAGDYEDPDRTAWALEDHGDDEDEHAPDQVAEEFPADDR